MKRILIGVAALFALSTALQAQSSMLKPEVRPYAGVNVPLGAQRDLFSDASLVGAQLALEVKPSFHVVTTFGWVSSPSTYALTNEHVNIYTYDIGLEFNLVEPLGGKWELKPFFGLGGGARTYAFTGSALKDRTCASGYAAVGTEFQIAPWAFRLETRDNLFCYKSPLAGVKSRTRNDAGISLGIAYHFR